MRMPKYLSPTSLKLFYSDRDQFYLQYLCETRLKRSPQTDAMSVGSAFDAYVKSFLVERLIGKEPEFEFNTIFEKQVEEHNRDFAREAGRIVFDAYQAQGALSDILLDLEGCVGKPRFETDIEGYVSAVSVEIGDVPFLGKPDIFFITKKGARVIFDWKVNGYCSAYNYSPKPGYVRIRTKDSKTGMPHSKAILLMHNGIRIAASHPLCSVEPEWAAQLSIYAWLLGEDVGASFIVAIDQIACSKNAFGQKEFRIAQHRSLVTEKFQQELFKKAHDAWYAIQAGHPFMEMTKQQSDARCATLDAMANTPVDESFDEILR